MAKTDNHASLVVCDAGPLIHLDEIGALDLLADFARVLVPPAVWSEVLRHRPAVLSGHTPTLERIAPELPAPPDLETLSQVLGLHAGESEALRLALAHPSALLITDDTAARLAATSLGIQARGTIGILIRAIRRNQRTKPQVLELLRSLPTSSTMHLKRSLLDTVIREVDQQA